jgi:hypothetical protein
LEELQAPPKWMMTPFLICSCPHHKTWWSGAPSYEMLLPGPPMWWSKICPLAAYPNLIAYATNLEAELHCTICNIWLWGKIDMPLWYWTNLITWHLARGIFCILYFVL